jgi:hypothetical protein
MVGIMATHSGRASSAHDIGAIVIINVFLYSMAGFIISNDDSLDCENCCCCVLCSHMVVRLANILV